MVVAYVAGESARVIGERHGVAETSVLAVLHERGVTVTAIKLTESDVQQAARLYAENWTLRAIGEALGVNRRTVKNALVREGVELRVRTKP